MVGGVDLNRRYPGPSAVANNHFQNVPLWPLEQAGNVGSGSRKHRAIVRSTVVRSWVEARLPSPATTDSARQGFERAAEPELEPAVVAGAFLTYVFSQLFISQNMCRTDSRPWYPCDSSGRSTKRTVAPWPFNAL